MTNKSDNVIVSADNSNSLTVLDKSGKSIDFGKIIVELASLNSSNGAGITQLKSIAELRSTEPTQPGELASVLEYNTGTNRGGGLFVYDAADKTTAEDFGLNIVTPEKARWKRVVLDYNNVTVIDFGAVPDGKVDCLEAVTRMFDWSQKNNPATGIRFTAGVFLLSKFDISSKEISRFKISGAPVNFGFFASTTLLSDQKNNEVMFSVKARYVEISGFVVKGQSKGDGSTVANTKGFFKNIIPGGQFLRLSCVEFRYLGGRALDIIDTLDCKFDQFYGRYCQNSIVYARWSGQAQGVWDHSTAIELANFNIQHNTLFPALDIPRCTQSIIRNGWIEHTEFPGDLSNGQWIIETFNLEDCANPLKLAYARIIMTQKNLQSGSKVDFTPEGERWLSEYEEGNVEMANWGMILNGSLNYDYVTSQHRMDNRTDKDVWFYLGEVAFPTESNQLNIKIVGSGGYSTVGETQNDYSQRTAEGAAYIAIQATSGGPYATWHGEGSSPVIRVHIEGTSSACKIYVKIGQYTGQSIALLETNGVDRYQAGVHFLFRKSFTKCVAEKSAELDATPVICFEQHWTGNKSVGFGYNNNKELIIHGTSGKVAEFDEATSCLKVRINGQVFGIEMRKLKA